MHSQCDACNITETPQTANRSAFYTTAVFVMSFHISSMTHKVRSETSTPHFRSKHFTTLHNSRLIHNIFHCTGVHGLHACTDALSLHKLCNTTRDTLGTHGGYIIIAACTQSQLPNCMRIHSPGDSILGVKTLLVQDG